MPRVARIVVPAHPHHATQRGNRRAQVFYEPADYRAYLDWLREYSERFAVTVLAYCLMPNHVHGVLVPRDHDGLENVMRPLSMRYARRFNRKRDATGVLWQGRFYSSVLDDAHLWNAVRYVERNPVRARLVDRAEHYEWSSAAAHCGLRDDPLLPECRFISNLRARIPDWSRWLAKEEGIDELDRLRRNTAAGLPCGAPEFIDDLERTSGRCLRPKPRGRPAADPPPSGRARHRAK